MNKFYTVFKYYFLLLLLFAFSADILGQATYKLIKSTSKLVADTKNIFSKAVVMAFFILAFSANSFGVDVTHTFSSTNGSIDANINFTTQQNSSANAPAFSGNLRLYYNSGGDGCSITLTPSNGAVITAVELYAVS
nr:hypothetical protein [Chitinophagales bacterium]